MTTTIRAGLAALAFALGACVGEERVVARTGASLFAATADAQWRLPRGLQEISGLAVGPDGRLFAHNDEIAVISELSVEAGRVVKRFAIGDPIERGDFEGLAITRDGTFFLVESTGRVLRFREAEDGAVAPFEAFDTGLRDVCEIEGLAHDGRRGRLLIGCKTHATPDAIMLYAWAPGRSARTALQASAAETAKAAFVDAFRPSSVEIDPRTDRIIVLSARDRALAEFDASGALTAARRLAAGHPQPEGAAILPDGALVIADEGGDLRALLTRYPRAP